MKRRWIMLLAVFALMATACGGDLGLGEADCASPANDISSSNILTVQAVPTAKYTPCLNELRVAWDSVDWFAEDGRAGLEIVRSFDTFLTSTVTATCDVSGAVPVDSGYPDIERYEDIDAQPPEIEIAIIPSGEGPLSHALVLVDELAGDEIDDRPVDYSIDDAIDESVSSRVELALSEKKYVWVVDEVDVEDGTVQLRIDRASPTENGLAPREALDRIEDVVPGVFYRGSWFFTFEGGCITYDFDASGSLAETVAADADDALGFYPAFELREFAEENGFDLG
jgi:hypothetical protein